MSNSITSTGTVTLTTPSTTIRQSLVFDVDTTGSNYTMEAKNINSGSWQALTTSSLSDIKTGLFYNTTPATTIAIARDNAGANVLTSLDYDQSAFIPMSGSIATQTLYARSYVSTSLTSAALEYTLVES